MTRVIAFYLPQYHPIKENDEWWGAGFTEWVNVAKAKPLFRGHKQPKIPADLGFYDLRLQEVREAQAELARGAGIEGFCYWHYWFGNDRRLLERPFNEVLRSGKPDLPFCLGWANHSWYQKTWRTDVADKLLIEQTYGGPEEYKTHFYGLLPAFRDERYIRVDGKPLFVVYEPNGSPEITRFIEVWRGLAHAEGLTDFHFVARDANSRAKHGLLRAGFDAIYNDDVFNIHHLQSLPRKVIQKVQRDYIGRPTLFSYRDAMKSMVIDDCRNIDVFPLVAPRWDHSPRSGNRAIILTGETPELFGEVVRNTRSIINEKPPQHQVIFLKSWNEWGEGNYMEPDIETGHAYLEALRSAVTD